MRNVISLIYDIVCDNIDISDKLVVAGDFELPRNAIFIPDKVSGHNVDEKYDRKTDIAVWFAVEHNLIDVAPFLLENQNVNITRSRDYTYIAQTDDTVAYKFYCKDTGLLLIPRTNNIIDNGQSKYVACDVFSEIGE